MRIMFDFYIFLNNLRFLPIFFKVMTSKDFIDVFLYLGETQTQICC